MLHTNFFFSHKIPIGFKPFYTSVSGNGKENILLWLEKTVYVSLKLNLKADFHCSLQYI
jgi:hypothetical protein